MILMIWRVDCHVASTHMWWFTIKYRLLIDHEDVGIGVQSWEWQACQSASHAATCMMIRCDSSILRCMFLEYRAKLLFLVAMHIMLDVKQHDCGRASTER